MIVETITILMTGIIAFITTSIITILAISNTTPINQSLPKRYIILIFISFFLAILIIIYIWDQLIL